jgi:hypothetical protein
MSKSFLQMTQILTFAYIKFLHIISPLHTITMHINFGLKCTYKVCMKIIQTSYNVKCLLTMAY